jgi:hypothetical protein
MSEPVPRLTSAAAAAPARRIAVLPQVRAVAMALAAGAAGYGLYVLQAAEDVRMGDGLLLAAFVIAVAAQVGLRYPAPDSPPPPLAPPHRHRAAGLAIAALGAALWAFATQRLYHAWVIEFDTAWFGWIGAVILLGIGLDLAWGIGPRPPVRRWNAWLLVSIAVLLAVAAVYRLGNIKDFPGEAGITQIEDLQVGNFGWAYLHGYRLRWEYLSSTWLAALGIWLGGPTQFAERIPFAVVSALKVVPLFVWLRLAVGTAGAVVGTGLLTASFWDVVLSRIPNNHNTLVVCIVFALLAGPVRRGRPSAYVLLGFIGGYILHEYVAYRPLALIAVIGATIWSLRDVAAARWVRIARPLLTVALLVTMVMPLFLVRIAGRFRLEYLDGWNRAHAITGYYNPEDTWQRAALRRVARARDVLELLTVHGDRSPVRNVPGQPPLIDPITCGLLVLGIAGAAAHLLRPIPLLTLAGFVVTVSGTLIFTGNFDVARVGGAVPYVYALAGFGAAGVYAAWAQAWGRPGRALAAAALAVAIVYAGVWCTRNLVELWTNPVIRRAHRNNLAYLSIWLGQHVRPGERVLGIAPGFTNVLEGHDGSWLRGGDIGGVVTWDIQAALRQWEHEPGPMLVFVYAGRSTAAVAEFLASEFPELAFTYDADPLGAQADVAWARVPGPPPQLAERLARWDCRGAHARFAVVGPGPNEVPLSVETTVPFIAKCTWPAVIPDTLYRLAQRPNAIQTRFTADFAVATAGDYRFSLELYAGTGTLRIDDVPRDMYAHTPVPLAVGMHRLEVTAEFAPLAMEPAIELLWSGPDTGGRPQLMPFYRLTPLAPSCAPAGSVGSAGAAPDAADRFLAAWLVLGPFARPPGSRGLPALVDVPALSAANTGGRTWTPLPQRDAFTDLDAFFTAGRGGSQWLCAYAATRVESPTAQLAYLQLAGSGDQLRAWANGRALSAQPLAIGQQPMRHAFALHAGVNALVIESCQDVGSWYFVARITDRAGSDIPDLRVSAALPSEPFPVEETATPPVQLVDGFAAARFAQHNGSYADHRGGSPSWWSYTDEEHPDVAWDTAPVPERRRTIAAATIATSRESGDAALAVNGRVVLHFPIGANAGTGPWVADGYRVALVPKGFFDGEAALLLIGVPEDAVTPGTPLGLRVSVSSTLPRAWFMLKGYEDTVQHEQLTPEIADAALAGEWESTP